MIDNYFWIRMETARVFLPDIDAYNVAMMFYKLSNMKTSVNNLSFLFFKTQLRRDYKTFIAGYDDKRPHKDGCVWYKINTLVFKQLFKSCENMEDTDKIGVMIKMIPFINIYYNILCKNPTEEIEQLIVPINTFSQMNKIAGFKLIDRKVDWWLKSKTFELEIYRNPYELTTAKLRLCIDVPWTYNNRKCATYIHPLVVSTQPKEIFLS